MRSRLVRRHRILDDLVHHRFATVYLSVPPIRMTTT